MSVPNFSFLACLEVAEKFVGVVGVQPRFGCKVEEQNVARDGTLAEVNNVGKSSEEEVVEMAGAAGNGFKAARSVVYNFFISIYCLYR